MLLKSSNGAVEYVAKKWVHNRSWGIEAREKHCVSGPGLITIPTHHLKFSQDVFEDITLTCRQLDRRKGTLHCSAMSFSATARIDTRTSSWPQVSLLAQPLCRAALQCAIHG